MNTKTQLQSLLARLIEGVHIAKLILRTALLMYKPDGIVNKLEDKYKALNDILKLDLADNGFLDETDIVDRLPQIRASKPHIAAMVSVINIGLATFKLFSETELDQVLKSLFTAIVPVNTDILQRIDTAYIKLLHKVAFSKAMNYDRDLGTLVSEIKATRPEWLAMHYREITRCETQCLSQLAHEMAPMEQVEFIMLWECALNSMVRQSRIIRDVILKIPNEFIEASEQPDATGPETTIRESILENNKSCSRDSNKDDDTLTTANDDVDNVGDDDDVEVDNAIDTADNSGGDNENDDGDIRGIDNVDIVDTVLTIDNATTVATANDDNDVTGTVDNSVATDNGDDDVADTIATTNDGNDVADTIVNAIATANGGNDVTDTADKSIATVNDDNNVADTIDNAIATANNAGGDVYAFQDDSGVDVLPDDSDDIFYDASDNIDIALAENELTPDDAQPEVPLPQSEKPQPFFPNISTSPSLLPKKRNFGAIDDESDSASGNSMLGKKAKVIDDTVPPDDMEVDEPTVSDSINNQQTPQLLQLAIRNQEPKAPTISPARSPTRTVEEYMQSGLPNPYISNRNRYKTSRFEPGSYTRRRMQRRF